jgi:hypothetical protein
LASQPGQGLGDCLGQPLGLESEAKADAVLVDDHLPVAAGQPLPQPLQLGIWEPATRPRFHRPHLTWSIVSVYFLDLVNAF